MKTLLPSLIIALFALGCTETIYEEVIKEVKVPGPTQFVATSTEKECEKEDTTSVSIVMAPTFKNGEFTQDTLVRVETACNMLIKIRGYILVPKDSIVPGPVQYLPGDSILVPGDSILVAVPGPIQYLPGEPYAVYDTIWQTIYDRSVVHADTMYYPSMIRPIYSVPDGFQTHINEFYTLAGPEAIGGVLLISYVHPDDLPGEDWVSESFWIGGRGSQMYIGVSESLPPELHRASILRELARLQLKKKYVTDESKILCPWWNPNNTITQQNLNELFANQQPI